MLLELFQEGFKDVPLYLSRSLRAALLDAGSFVIHQSGTEWIQSKGWEAKSVDE
jgi:hypothetical protein